MFVILFVPLLYSVIAHEAAHGVVAYLFGDDTAKRAGRLTPNPLAHLDPVGTLMLFLVGFGWAKPVPVDYTRFRSFRPGLICVSLAGCVTNIVIATAALALLRSSAPPAGSNMSTILIIIARINLILGALNLIPIPPLDGSKVLMGFLPREAQFQLARLEPYGFPILIILLFTGLLEPVIIFVQNIILILISGVLNLIS
jgi:Zn-dependent protease